MQNWMWGLSWFNTQPSLGRTEVVRMVPKREIKRKYPASGCCGQKCLVDVRGQRSQRLVSDDRKAIGTQVITRYNQRMQNTISDHMWSAVHLFKDILCVSNCLGGALGCCVDYCPLVNWPLGGEEAIEECVICRRSLCWWEGVYVLDHVVGQLTVSLAQ